MRSAQALRPQEVDTDEKREMLASVGVPAARCGCVLPKLRLEDVGTGNRKHAPNRLHPSYWGALWTVAAKERAELIALNKKPKP